MKVLVTGGAGFIGRHAVRDLVASGHDVVVLDVLDPQVHRSAREEAGPNASNSTRIASPDARAPPSEDPSAGDGPLVRRLDEPAPLPDRLSTMSDLPGTVSFVRADVRDRAIVREALAGADAVLHLAAAVGVGQSMYEIEEYVDVNTRATAILLEELAESEVERLVVASSMSIYGEGLYRDGAGNLWPSVTRSDAAASSGRWDPVDDDGVALEPLPTPETKCPAPASVYAQTKYDQERLCLIVGGSYGIATTALRFFNVYGPGQALDNPYTGVLAIFGSQVLNGRRPTVYEDGNQMRDFVHVNDVANACRLAVEDRRSEGHTLNIASGRPRSINQVADALLEASGRGGETPDVTGRFRRGDVRHCIADITLARDVLGFEPRVPFEEGLAGYVDWLDRQEATDRSGAATQELEARGLLR